MDNNIIDWSLLYSEYISDETMSYQKLSEKHKVDLRKIELKGHSENWPRQRADVIMRVRNNIKEQTVNELTKFHKKLREIGQLLTGRAIKLLAEGSEPKTPRDVLNYITEGIELEARGLGINLNNPQSVQNTLIHFGNQPPERPTIMTWGDGTPLPPYRKPIETFAEEQEWLKEEELKKQQEQALSSQTS